MVMLAELPGAWSGDSARLPVPLGVFWGCQLTFCTSHIEVNVCRCLGAKLFATGELGVGLTALQPLPQRTMGLCLLLLLLLLSHLQLLQPKPRWLDWAPSEQCRPSKALAKEG